MKGVQHNFEMIWYHFKIIFNSFLVAFRSGFGFHSILLRIIEEWKKAVYSYKYLLSVLVDITEKLRLGR